MTRIRTEPEYSLFYSVVLAEQVPTISYWLVASYVFEPPQCPLIICFRWFYASFRRSSYTVKAEKETDATESVGQSSYYLFPTFELGRTRAVLQRIEESSMVIPAKTQ